MMFLEAIEDVGETFGMTCIDNAMNEIGILSGDEILIKQAHKIPNGKIAAI